MANWTNPYPSWGDTGSSPSANFQYDGGDQVNEKHFDYLWDQLNKSFDNVLAHSLQDDGSVVIENDTYLQWRNAADNGDINAWKINTNDELKTDVVVNLGGDLVADGGEVVWDESAGYIPQERLETDSLTVSGGDGLKSGGSVSLGSSVSLDIEPADFAGDGLKDDGVDNLAVEPADFAGQMLSDDGADNLTVNLGNGLVNNSGSVAIDTDAIQLDELDESIIPTWTGQHTFNGGVVAGSTVNITSGNELQLGGETALQSVAASGQVTLSGGSAVVDTGISAVDATLSPFIGVDDPDADFKGSARLFWDDSVGTYHIEIIESGTDIGNPTVNYDILRCR